jgi:hypothetical protein
MVLEVAAIAVQHDIHFLRTERGREVTHQQRNSVVMVTVPNLPNLPNLRPRIS